MDVFKLITRSTNLQKGAKLSRHEANHRDIPSAGATPHPQFLAEEGLKKGTKRKRDSARAGVEDPSSVETHPTGNGASTKAGNPVAGDLDASKPGGATQTTKLDEAACKKILKTHKLKATLVEEPAPPTPKPKPKQRRKDRDDPPPPPPSGRDVLTPIFPQPLLSFQHLPARYGVSRRIMANLRAQGYREPADVQIGALPLLLGRDADRGVRRRPHGSEESPAVDLLAVAPTGSGKTLAFVLPVLHGILQERRRRRRPSDDDDDVDANKHEGGGGGGIPTDLQAVILAPTHELVDQIANEARKLAAGTGIRIVALKKGMKLHRAEHGPTIPEDGVDGTCDAPNPPPASRPHVVTATPQMLLHALSRAVDQPPAPLPTVTHLVLDEADILLDPLFREQTLRVWALLPAPRLRTSLWSATIGASIESLAIAQLRSRRASLVPPHAAAAAAPSSEPRRTADNRTVRLVVGLKDAALPTVDHRLVYTGSEPGKLLAMRQLLHPGPTPTPAPPHASSKPSSKHSSSPLPPLPPPFLIFTQTIPRAIALHAELLYDIPALAGGSSRLAVLHADLSATQRGAIMARFRAAEIWVLITTDLLSRGVDFRGVNGVVNYDIPTSAAGYVHRAGRTGRAGRGGGVCVTFYTEGDVQAGVVRAVVGVVAASQKAGWGKQGGDDGEGVHRWLLDALPRVDKKTKARLKRRGVEARRAEGSGGKGGADEALERERRRARISTKSGFERKVANRRKGAVEARVRGREVRRGDGGDGRERESDGDGEGWAGIED